MSETILTVGAGEEYTTINAAILAADDIGGNADIQVNAGTYVNDGGYLWDGINNVIIEGVGGTVKIVDPTYYAGGKAAIVTGGDNIVLKNLDISGVQVPDANGAAVRYDQGSLTLINDYFHDNQNGILGAADPTGSITVENSTFDHNGVGGNGHTHDIYVGNIANFTLTDSTVTDAEIGHEVKSRAENNTITNNVIADDKETASYTIDLPNGGNATITGNTIEQGPFTQNSAIDAYGEEGVTNTGTAVNFSDNTVINNGPSNGALWSGGGGDFTGSGNNYYNVSNLGQAGSVGYTTDSNEPALNILAHDNTTAASTSTDTISLSLSEDAWQGDAKADILIDGVPVARDQTITASHAAGQDQTLTLTVPSATSHVVSVEFTNDAYGGLPSQDRNLYIDNISVNGVSTGQSAPEDGGGIESFIVNGGGASSTTAVTSGSSNSGSTTTSPATDMAPAAGQDQIGIVLSEDAYQGDAQVSIAIDGETIDSDLTLSALHGVANYAKASDSSQTQTLTFNVADAATHDVQVDFLNDAYAGTPSTDRNAYIDDVIVNGQSTGATAALMSAGLVDLTVPGTAPAAAALSGSTSNTTSTPSNSGSGSAENLISTVPPAPITAPAGADYTLEGYKWATTDLTYMVNPTLAGSDPSVLAAVTTAFNKWSQATGLTFTQVAYSADGYVSADIQVGFASDLTESNQIGLTGYAENQNGNFVPGTVASYLESPQNSPIVNGVYTDYGVSLNTALEHEIGHALGLGLSPDSNSVMNQYATTQSISAGDIAGIDYLYPSLLDSSASSGSTGSSSTVTASTGTASTAGSSTGASTTLTPSNGSTQPSGGSSTDTPPAARQDRVDLFLSEDAFQGDAEFTVSVNGREVGATSTVTALNTDGQTEAVSIPTTLDSGANTVGITFVNDAYDGSVSTDRNLYLDSAAVNGVTVSGRETLLSDGTATFSFSGSNPTPVVTSTLVLNVSEDAYQGNAQMVVAVDGQTLGYYTVTASHAAGQSQAVTISDIPESFSPDDIAVSFVNDAYGGSPSMDRNLYINSMQFDGQSMSGGSVTFLNNGTQHFTATAPANWTG